MQIDKFIRFMMDGMKFILPMHFSTILLLNI